MLVLAFDTCMDKMYVTLVKDGKTLSNTEVKPDVQVRSPLIFEALKKMLHENNLTFSDLDLIATNVGTGSFTAIRTCITIARVMAQELNKRLIGVTSFEILQNLPLDYGNKPTLIALDARRESAYVAINGEIRGIVLVEELKKIISEGDYFIITDEKLQAQIGGVAYQTLHLPLGEIIAKIATEKSKTEDGDWGKLQPLYLAAPANATL